MARFRLNTVLELRRQQEKSAELRLADAVRARDDAERQEQRLSDEAARANQRLRPVALEGDGPSRAADVLAAARFSARRRDELAVARSALESFRAGPLAAARQADEEARLAHRAARRAREMLEKQLARHLAAENAVRERRADEELADAAEALRVRGGPK